MSAPYQIDFCQNFNNLWNECFNECGFNFKFNEAPNGYRFGRDYNRPRKCQRAKIRENRWGNNNVVIPSYWSKDDEVAITVTEFGNSPSCSTRQFARDYNWDKDRHFQVEKKGNKYVHWTDDPEIWPYDYKPWEAKEY